MSDFHNEFQELLKKISLSSTKIYNLRRGRDALRDKIESYYKDLNEEIPKFCWQGSFSMKTTIVQSGEDYDIDDGVYLENLPELKDQWPKTEEVHEKIYDAVEGHTDSKPKDKTSCIRVQYKAEYHVDLVIYGEYQDKIYLAKKGREQWEENNPKLFKEWFDNKLKKYGEQFRSVFKYIKKWAYYNGHDEITGFLITILVGNNFVLYAEQDDKSLSQTLINILADIKQNRIIVRPVYPYKNMIEDMTDNQIDSFIKKIDNFSEKVSEAVNTEGEKAIYIFQDLFGEFPNKETSKSESYSYSPSIIRKETKPWGN